MQNKDLSKLLRDESFLNYCFKRNAEDVRYWEKWLQENPEHRDQVEEIKTLAVMLTDEVAAQEEDAQYNLLRKHMLAKEQESPRRFPLTPFFRIGIAASLIAVCSLAVYITVKNKEDQPNLQALTNDIAPGGNRATLTLADGRMINLDEAQTGIVVGEDNITYQDGDPLAVISADLPVGGEREVSHLVLTTPNGGQYQITLPDGSRVWLNAASTLKYPSRFDGMERKVEISGEAFFSVAKDTKRPFRVSSNGQEIEVLGTEFNVSAYPDENETRTTLVEGSIRLSSLSLARELSGASLVPDKQLQLVSGEQATLTTKGLTKTTVDTEPFIAWKNGYFRFREEDIQSIMRKLARWYDIDVQFEGNVSGEYYARISRFKNISQVLTVLAETGTVHFKVEGRRVTVMP